MLSHSRKIELHLPACYSLMNSIIHCHGGRAMPRIRLLFGILVLLLMGPLAPAVQGDEPQKSDELARYDRRIKPADREHWAYQPVKKPAPPAVKNADWVRNP